VKKYRFSALKKRVRLLISTKPWSMTYPGPCHDEEEHEHGLEFIVEEDEQAD
jgi:hypothetical protein